MDEVDSAATWAFIHQQQSLWSSDQDNTTSGSQQTFPSVTLSSQTDFTSPDSALTMHSEFPNFPSPSTTLTSSGSSFISDSSEYRNNSASVMSQDSGFDETDSGSGYRRNLDQDFAVPALPRNCGLDLSGSLPYSDPCDSGELTHSSYEASDFSLDDCHMMKPEELVFLLKAGLEKYLLIDCRSFLEFNTSHIQQSANICCSKIVKRRLQRNKIHIRDLLVQNCHIDTDEYLDVIVYDQCTENPSRLTEDNFLAVLLSKLSSTFNRVALLRGGFLAFQAMYPSLCESKTNSYRCAALTSLSQPCLPVSNVGPTRILPFLYLGSQQDALSPDIAQVNEITYILNVSASGPKPSFIPDGHFLRIPVNDNYSAKLTPHFEQAFQFLDKVREANGCCLVHCLAGISRSPTLAIAYIMKHLNMSSDDAYRYVKDKRPTISPNFNFLGQLLEFEKQLKNEKELNNNDDSESCQDNRSDPWVLPSPTLTSSHAVSQKKGCIQTQGSYQTYVIDPNMNYSTESTHTYDESLVKSKVEKSDTITSGLALKKSTFSLKSSTLSQSDQTKLTHSMPERRESAPGRPCVLNLGLDTSARRVPFTKSLETQIVPSKSLSDITEGSETPSPVITSKSQESKRSTSFTLATNPPISNPNPLLSPFPCGNTTILTRSSLSDSDQVPYSGKDTKTSASFSEHSSVVKTEKSKQFISKGDRTFTVSSLPESKSIPQSLGNTGFPHPFSITHPVLKPGGKRPLRSTLSLALSPCAPSKASDNSAASAVGNFAPSACKIEKKIISSTRTQDTSCVGSSIPNETQNAFLPISSNTLTTSHAVKLKSFTGNLSASLPLSLMAQSPTTSLAKLHFGSNENSDSDTESSKMDTSERTESHVLTNEKQKLSYNRLNDRLEKLSSFPSTSLDKLNFTPCLSSSNENLMLHSTSPRTSGVKRPLNNDVTDVKESEMSSGSPTTGSPSSSSSSVTSPTCSSQQKVVVRKRENRGKRTMVRPNSIAFSTYPTFDLGSDCQNSPHSSSSSASQDDTSELYSQNGKKSKPSEYMSDVRFRLGRYSEREVYHQITAAVEAAMMKSQSFEASRKSKSLDDILSSEDDKSTPNSPKMSRMSVAPPIL